MCYIPFGIKQLTVTPEGGTFTLGCGDAIVEVLAGAVEKETSVHYAIILHGPFVFSAGYKPASVVVYLNMDGIILLNPVRLLLSYWCIREEGDDEDTYKFLRAPHRLEVGQKYIFTKQKEADFTSHSNMAVGILSISEAQCLYCVVTEEKKFARYIATSFSQSSPEGTLLFRIQPMCASLEWNEVSSMPMISACHIYTHNNILAVQWR